MFKGKSTATVQTEIATLDKRRLSLEARHSKAAAASLNAVAARRVLLTETDEPDAKALDAADRAVREAEDAKEGAADALREVESRIADARDRLARLQAAEERERQAVAIEASAAAADKAIDRIRKAASDIDNARADLAAALLPDAVACYAPPARPPVDYMPNYLTTALYYDYQGKPMHDTLGPEQVAARIVGHIVSTVMPDLGIVRAADAAVPRANGQPTAILAPIADAEAAHALLTDPMRAAAAGVRSTLDAPVA